MRKKLFTFLLALAASVGMGWAAVDDSGECGDNVTYSFNGTTGALVITGTGPMTTYTSKSTSLPWKDYKNAITSVTVTNGVTSVSQYTFGQCTNLTTVVIGNDVETIGQFAFNDCGTSLTSLTIGDKVESIGMAAFLNAKGVTSITLPSTLQTIGSYAFCNMTALESITIPSNVTSIETYAFSGCTALTSIYTEATTPPTLGTKAFDNVPTSIPLYVPNGSVAAYTAAAQWNAFNIQGYDPAPGGGSTQIAANVDPEHAGVYYATFFDSAKKYALPNDGTEAYAAEVSGDALLLHKIAEGNDVLPENTAVIFKATSSKITLTESDADAVTVTATNNLHGVNVATSVDEIPEVGNTIYVLSGVDGVVGFYKYSGETLGAHKAYIALDAQGAAKAPRRLVFHTDEEQGIEDVQNAVQSTKLIENGQLVIIKNGVKYNAQGQELR